MPYSHYLKTYLPQSSFSFQNIWFSVILQKFYLKSLPSLLLWKTCYVEYDHTKTKLISCDRLKTFPRTRCVEYEDYLKEAHDTMEITDVNKNLYNTWKWMKTLLNYENSSLKDFEAPWTMLRSGCLNSKST